LTNVRDIMTTDVETCSLLDTVEEVAVKMKEENVGVIPIVDNDKLAGVVTDRDIVLRCIAENYPTSAKVEEIMSDERLITVSADTTTNEAARIMAKHQIRRLPVVENGKLEGIVALGDLAVRDLTDSQAKEALSEISEKNPSEIQH